MEVSRTYKPKNNFLRRIRKICNKKKIVLIFDECSSGFRECNGGLHKKFGVYPDISMFGKALGNGYAITGILGKKKIMKCAEKTFITILDEGIGFAAGIATLKSLKINLTKSKQIGKYVKKMDLSSKKQPETSLWIRCHAGFKFSYKESNIYKTFIILIFKI